MGWGANTLKSWKVGHGFEKVENPWFKLIKSSRGGQKLTEAGFIFDLVGWRTSHLGYGWRCKAPIGYSGKIPGDKTNNINFGNNLFTLILHRNYIPHSIPWK